MKNLYKVTLAGAYFDDGSIGLQVFISQKVCNTARVMGEFSDQILVFL